MKDPPLDQESRGGYPRPYDLCQLKIIIHVEFQMYNYLSISLIGKKQSKLSEKTILKAQHTASLKLKLAWHSSAEACFSFSWFWRRFNISFHVCVDYAHLLWMKGTKLKMFQPLIPLTKIPNFPHISTNMLIYSSQYCIYNPIWS